MKRSLIHRGFFREMFRQLRAKGLVAALLLAGLNLIFFSAFITRDPINASYTHYDPRLMALPMLIILYIMVPIMVFGAYRWLNKRVQSDFYHAIPLTRTQIYATTSAAILTWLLIALGSFAVVQTILYTVFGLPFNYLLYLCVFLNMLIASVEITAAFSIGAALTGRRFTGFFQSLTVLFIPRLLLTSFWILTEIDSGFTLPFSQLPFFLNPEFNIAATPIHSLIWGINFANVPAMLYSLLYSFALLALGCAAFNKRKSELAEIPYASKVLQTATRVVFGMPQLLGITIIMNVYLRYGEDLEFMPMNMFTPLCVTSVVFSFLFYCLYELISSKKMKRVVKAMPAFGFCILLALFFIFVPNWVSKLRSQKVVAAEDIKYFEISNESTLIVPGRILGSDSYPDYVLTHHRFTGNAGKTLIANVSKESAEREAEYFLDGFTTERVIVKDGGLFKKAVMLDDMRFNVSPGTLLIRACLNEQDFADQLYAYPKGRITYAADGLTAAEAREVGRLFREDYEKLTVAQKKSLILSRNSLFSVERTPETINLSIELFGFRGTENYTMHYRINELTPNAAEAMLGYLNARSAKEVQKQLKKLVAWMEHPNEDLDFNNFMIGSYSLNTYGNLWYDDEKAPTPRDGHPLEYQVLKALSEAPVSNDPDRAVTIQILDYTNIEFRSSFVSGTAGFNVDDETRALIERWIKEKDLKPETYPSWDSM